jgi:hypothetical protein
MSARRARPAAASPRARRRHFRRLLRCCSSSHRAGAAGRGALTPSIPPARANPTRSLRSSLKGAGKRNQAKEEAPPATSSSRAVPTTTSGANSRGGGGGGGGAGPGGGPGGPAGGPHAPNGGPHAPGGGAPAGGRDKPLPPALTEAAMHHHYAQQLPSFRDVPPADKQLLFVRKLHLCAFTFDFSDPGALVAEKEAKRQTLLELVDYANSGAGKFTEAVSEDIIFMLASNLFRTLPPTRSHDADNFDPEEEEPTLEPAWPHLQARG